MSMDVLGALQYVGTGFSLVAFVVAAILLAYRARLTHRADIIKSAPEKERVEAIATTAEFFRVDVSGLTRAQQQQIALTQIHARARRDLLLAAVSLAVALLLAAITIASIFKPAGPAAVLNLAPGRDANFINSRVQIGGPNEEQIDDIVRRVLAAQARAVSASPPQERAVGEAVAAAQKGAAEGNATLQRALDLLKANNVAEAEAQFRAVADEKAARISQDKKDAAAAYRHLGAIAGIRDPKKALDAYEKALEFDPDDLPSLLAAGSLLVDRGNLDAAQARLDRVVSLASFKPFYKYWARLRLGDIQVQRGDLAGAQKSYRDGLAIGERLAKSNPGNARWQRALSVSYEKIGDVQVAQDQLASALQSYRDRLAIAERLAKSVPGNARWQRDLSVSYEKIGDVQVAQGELAGARKSYGDGLFIRERLAKSDPDNAGWQRDLSVSYEKIGDVQVAEGNLAGGLESYSKSLAIRERLAKSDPGNAQWQRDLSVSNERIGDVQLERDDLAGALQSYRDSLVISERLARADPGNALWQRDLSTSYENIGDVQVAQGDLAGALKSYRADLAIAERLAKSNPGNTGWQSDLATSYSKVATVLRKLGDTADALDALRQGRAILVRLTSVAPDDASRKNDLAWFDGQIAELGQ